MKKIIFVDDEPEVLRGLMRMLRGRRKEWAMEFLADSQEALGRLEEERFDVVVTDMRMPVVDGAALLEKVRQVSPSTVRIALSGHSEKASVMSAVRPTHQYLAKPVEKEQLEEVLIQALSLQTLLSDPALIELVTQVESLPALPQIFDKLLAEMESPDGSLKKIGDLISSDMGMTATILKVVNSAFFALPRNVSDPHQAVTLLGLETIKALVLSYQLFTVQGLKRIKGFSLKLLWSHSLNTALFARAIAQQLQWTQPQVDQAFITGMLHDVGKLTLMTVAREKYSQVVERARLGRDPFNEVEKQMLGTAHGEAGAYLLGLWGFHPTVLQAIGLHHRPRAGLGRGPDLLTVVHVADVLEHDLVVVSPNHVRPTLDLDYLAALGVADNLKSWRSICEELMTRGGTDAPGDPA